MLKSPTSSQQSNKWASKSEGGRLRKPAANTICNGGRPGFSFLYWEKGKGVSLTTSAQHYARKVWQEKQIKDVQNGKEVKLSLFTGGMMAYVENPLKIY